MELLDKLRKGLEAKKAKKVNEAQRTLVKQETLEAVKGLRSEGYSNGDIAGILNDNYKDTFASYETRTPVKFFDGKTKPKDSKVVGDEVVYMTKPSFTDRMSRIALETPEEKIERKRTEKEKRDKKK